MTAKADLLKVEGERQADLGVQQSLRGGFLARLSSIHCQQIPCCIHDKPYYQERDFLTINPPSNNPLTDTAFNSVGYAPFSMVHLSHINTTEV